MLSGLSLNYVEQRGGEILEFLQTTAPSDHFGRLGNKSNSYYKLFNTIEEMCKNKEIILSYDFKVFNYENELFTVGGFKTLQEFNKYFKD